MIKPKVLFLCDGVLWRLTWPLEDPQTVKSFRERKAAIRRIRDKIRRRVVEFVSENA